MTEPQRKKPPHRNGPRIKLILQFFFISLLDSLRPVKRVSAPDPVIDPTKLQVWMVGHATMLINLYGTTILTDPFFGNWLPFPRRIVGPGLQLSQLPPIDILMISHVHWDHFHKPSVRKLANDDTLVITARHCADLAHQCGFTQVIELDNGDVHTINDVEITTYRPHHWGKRMPWEKIKRGFNSYVIEKNGKTIFYCGDSGYGSVFQEVRGGHCIDLALLPIGAYHPPSFRKVHMSPRDALQAMSDLDATEMIPFHFGSLRLSQEPMTEPEERLSTLVREREIPGVTILHNGEGGEFAAAN